MSKKNINLFEVGPRDGLQNEAGTISTEDKVCLVNKLSKSGLTNIETGSFVSPKWVPQMASSADVFAKIERDDTVQYSALTPNLMGLDAAISAQADEIAVFGAASESFSQKNINCSIDESVKRFIPVIEKALDHGLKVRGYVSCVVGCPYEGAIEPSAVASISKRLYDLGCYEISLGDTIGVGTPNQISSMIETVADVIPIESLAIHCHDTYGQALANIYAALIAGVKTIDSSVAGLGGCPYAAGASGNVASEDVVYLLQGMGLNCGVQLDTLIEAGNFISQRLGRANQSKVANALSTNS